MAANATARKPSVATGPHSSDDSMEVTTSQLIAAVPTAAATVESEASQETYKVYPSRFKSINIHQQDQPNMSGSEEEESIEIARGYGAKKSIHPLFSKLDTGHDMSQSMDLTGQPGGPLSVTGTPPFNPTRLSQVLEHDRLNKHSHGDRRKLINSDNQNANVESDNDASDGSLRHKRPLASKVTSRAARHNARGGPALGSVNLNTPQPYHPLREALRDGAGPQVLPTSAMSTTRQSFALPEMPNLTELVSGHRSDGTPLFSRTAKPKSRFTAAAKHSASNNAKPSHSGIAAIPIPTDDKALYTALELLHDKVAALEADKESLETRAEAYELEVLQLRAEIEQHTQRDHSDSGVGYETDEARVNEWEQEKAGLQTSIRTLQARLDHATRKAAKSQVTIKNLSHDRDQAHTKLIDANIGTDELKTESLAVSQEILKLQAELDQINRHWQKRLRKLTQQEAELRSKIERREKAIGQMSALTKELWTTRSALAPSSSHAVPTTSTPSIPTTSKKPMNVRSAKKTDTGFTRPSRKTSSHRTSSSTRAVVDAGMEVLSIDNMNDSSTDMTSNLRARSTLQQSPNLTKDDDFLSFMDGDEVAKLRQILEQDKARLPERPDGNATVESGDASSKRTPLPRKSSLKKKSQFEDARDIADEASRDVSFAFEQPQSAQSTKDAEDPSQDAIDITELEPTMQSLDWTGHSAASQRSGRRRSQRMSGNQAGDLTSSIILPDITLSGAAHGLPTVTAPGKITIQRPVPVTDRSSTPATNGAFDQTIRPGEDPGIALAIVLQGLESELAQLRKQLGQQQELYQAHDPSLSRRKRKTVFDQIQRLLTAVETRADQVYFLYDVLEGQKSAGQTMSKATAEVTLQLIGLHMDAILENNPDGHLPGTKGPPSAHGGADLPFEGFDTTMSEPTQ